MADPAAGGAGAHGGAAFDADLLVSSFRTCTEHLHDIPIRPFLTGCDEVKKIVLTLGSAFGIASSDITEKVGIMMERVGELETLAKTAGLAEACKTDTKPPEGPAPPVRVTLQYLVQYEMSKGVEKLNAGKYISGSRSLLRLMWFLDFLSVLLTRLLADTTELKECATGAYEEALAPHHPWIIRKTIGAAMYFLPAKAVFWRNLAGSDDTSFVRPRLQTFVELVEVLRVELWAFYRARKIDNLP